MKFKFLAAVISAFAVVAVACGGDDETPTTVPSPTSTSVSGTPTTEPTGTAEPTGTPGTPEPTGTPGTPEPTGTPGTPEPTGTPGTPEPTGTPGTPEPTGTPGTPEPTGTPGTPEPTETPGTPVPGETIVDYLSGDENYSTFVELLEIAELEDSLMGEGPLTLFAPTNAAFDLMPQADLEDLREDPEALAALLNYHLVAEELTAEDLAEVGFVTTVEGSNVSVTPQAGTVTLNNNALVTESDIEAGNGIVHSINRVLTPPAS